MANVRNKLTNALQRQTKLKAYACPYKDQEHHLAFYKFPTEHWRMHIRITSPIESSFAPARLRTDNVKDWLAQEHCVDHDLKADPTSRKTLGQLGTATPSW
jgi:transposase-like protein